MTAKLKYGVVIVLAKSHCKVQHLKWHKATPQTPLLVPLIGPCLFVQLTLIKSQFDYEIVIIMI